MAVAIHVSKTGDSAASGGASHPLATLAGALDRLRAIKAGQGLRLDLAALGIQQAGERTAQGYWHPVLPAPSEFFMDGAPLTLARWPNSGYESMAAVTDPGGSSQGSVFLSGGFGNRISNNIFVEDPLAIGLSAWPEADWLAQFGPGTLWERYLLQDVDIQGPAYLARYPELAHFYGTPARPLSNRIDLDLAVHGGRLQSGQPGWCSLGRNLETGSDPGFVDPLHLDWTLRGDSMVFGQLDGFAAIPFHAIGPGSSPGAQR